MSYDLTYMGVIGKDSYEGMLKHLPQQVAVSKGWTYRDVSGKGENLKFPIRKHGRAGTSFVAMDGTYPYGYDGADVIATVNTKKMSGGRRFGEDTIKRMGSESSFVDGPEFFYEELVMDAKKTLVEDVLGPGNGIVATVLADGSAPTYTVDFPDLLNVGVTYIGYSGITYTMDAARTAKAVASKSGNTVTFAVGSSLATGDVITRYGSRTLDTNYNLTSLSQHASATETCHGIDPSTHLGTGGIEFTNGGVNTPWTKYIADRGLAQQYVNCDDDEEGPKIIYIHQDHLYEFIESYEGSRRNTDAKLIIGTSFDDLVHPFGRRKIKYEPQLRMPRSYAIGLDPKDVEIWEREKIHFVQQGNKKGDIFVRVMDTTGGGPNAMFQVNTSGEFALVVRNRRRLVKWSNLVVTDANYMNYE